MGIYECRIGEFNDPHDVLCTWPSYLFQKQYLEEKTFGIKARIVRAKLSLVQRESNEGHSSQIRVYISQDIPYQRCSLLIRPDLSCQQLTPPLSFTPLDDSFAWSLSHHLQLKYTIIRQLSLMIVLFPYLSLFILLTNPEPLCWNFPTLYHRP